MFAGETGDGADPARQCTAPAVATRSALSSAPVSRACAEIETVRPLAWRATPADVIGRWPRDEPLAALVSADPTGRGGPWSILACPGRAVSGWAGVQRALSNPLARREAQPDDRPPFTSGWLGWLGYEMGRALEPAVTHRAASMTDAGVWPAAHLCRCDGALAHDARTGDWFACGDSASLPVLDDRLPAEVGGVSIGAVESMRTRSEYESIVARAVEHIHAGDVFQVNLARQLRAEFTGSPRRLFLGLLDSMTPAYAALIEGPREGQAVLSMSPELFLHVDGATGRVVTRPIKGTAAGSAAALRLVDSAKDRAELAMIVDLMRNDLGRVCAFGSVRVAEARAIERHGSRDTASGVLHGVATVEGRLREGATIANLIAATFPAGSITGAPKIRAMQIIDALEGRPRGPYCGAVGFIDDTGSLMLNVAIRTAMTHDGALDYFVGAGIVADSDPSAEWAETEAKAAGFRRALAQMSARRAAP